MTPWVKVYVGIFFFLLGLGYLYKPHLIERIYAMMREIVFNDAHMALERRKFGIFFLLISWLFLYMGYTALYLTP